MSQPAIEFRDVWKFFHRHSGQLLLRTELKKLFTGRDPVQRFHALRGVSFQLHAGESLAVIGKNGAGKSTLLSLVAGLARPDRGQIAVQGRVAALLMLGSGFHPDLTGVENVHLNAALLGMSRRRTNQVFDEIVEFAELADFIDEPLRTYSTGMVMRLAFSVAVSMDPDILLIDEVLTVGDAGFQAKCFQKIQDFRRRGKSILCVSHAAGTAQKLCSRAIWLDHGDLMLDGPVLDVVGAFEGHLRARP